MKLIQIIPFFITVMNKLHIWFFLFALFISSCKHSDTENYSLSSNSTGIGINKQIECTINNNKETVFELFNDTLQMILVSFSRYSALPENNITIKTKFKIDQIKVSPQRFDFNLQQLDSNKYSFTVTGKKDLVVYINDSIKLFLFPLTNRSLQQEMTDISQLGVNSDPSLLQTNLIQHIIDSLSNPHTPVSLYFPPGIYKTATLYMKDNVYFHLDKNAIITGSMDTAHYPIEKMEIQPGYPKGVSPNTNGALIYFINVKNSGISGPGMITMQGSKFRRNLLPDYRWLNIIRVINSSHLRFSDSYLLDAIGWNTHLIRSDSIWFENVKIINEIPPVGWNPNVPEGFWNNTDGINPDASTNIFIDSVFAHCGDDCITLKITNTKPGNQQNIENIYVNNSIFLSSTGVLKCGTESLGEYMRNVFFKNIDVMDMKTGFPLKLTPRDKATIHDIHFENIWFEQSTGGFLECKIMQPRNKNQNYHPKVKDIYLKNIYLQHDSINAIFISLTPEYNVSNVTFDNLVVKGEKVGKIELAIFDLDEYTQNIQIK